MTRRLINFFFDHPLLLFIAAVLGTTMLVAMVSSIDDRRCAEIMAAARTQRDSLDAKIACEQLRSESAIAFAIGLSAGSRR